MALSDELNLEELKTWRDNIIAALKTPETVSSFGGMPDAAGNPVGVGRMPGRAQLLSELAYVEKKIDDLEDAEPYMRESRGAY